MEWKYNINDELSGSTDERPLGIPKGDACHSKNHDGVTQQIDDRFGNYACCVESFVPY